MKKLCSLILSLSILLFSSVAYAQYFPSVFTLQQFLEKYSPSQITSTGPHYVELSGTIIDIHYCNKGNHYDMTLEVPESKAIAPVGYDNPIITVHFRLHVEPMPFSIGDEIDVYGTLNALYSSVMVPCILADTINGTDDY